ncbi:hypothetical protein LTR27_001631 [Elasticomyces elasticus]|nr:hypothetical protein LTR27_001631 [Elasticomyces elasticus]
MSADITRKHTNKRTYADMDAGEESEASEYMPTKKGKRRALTAVEERTSRTDGSARKLSNTNDQNSSPVKRRVTRHGTTHANIPDNVIATTSLVEPSASSDGPVDRSPILNASMRPLTSTEASLKAALAQIAQLKAQLAASEHNSEQSVLRAHQDHMLHITLFSEQLEVRDNKYRKMGCLLNTAKRRSLDLEMDLAKNAAEFKVLEANVAIYTQQIVRLKLERDLYLQDAEHQQTLLSAAEEELQELRQIEMEDRAQRARDAEKQTLPPAYGSLPGDDPVMHPKEEKDSGGDFEVANFKHMIRSTFMAALAKAQGQWDAATSLPNRPPSHRTRADAELIIASISALGEASRNVDDVLKRATEFLVSSACTGTGDKAMKYWYRRQAARQEYVADRFAKLVLDLFIRIIAVFELRPLHPTFRPDETARMAVVWTAIDNCLLKALRTLFNRGKFEGRGGRLFEVQYYATQVSIAKGSLTNGRNDTAFRMTALFQAERTCFDKSTAWLQVSCVSQDAVIDANKPQDRLEAERMQARQGAGTDYAESESSLESLDEDAPDVPAAPGPMSARSSAPQGQQDPPRSAARQMILENRANATHRRMGIYRRSSLHNMNGGTPSGSQDPNAVHATNPVTPLAQTSAGRRSSRHGDYVTVSSEASIWPSEEGSDGDV